jgi:hypothetical protein
MADWGRLHIGKLGRVGPGKKASIRSALSLSESAGLNRLYLCSDRFRSLVKKNTGKNACGTNLWYKKGACDLGPNSEKPPALTLGL